MIRLVALIGGVLGAMAFAAFNSGPYLAQSQPTISVFPTSGKPGDTITITGSGFPPGEIVALYVDAPTAFFGQPGPRADAKGNITFKDRLFNVAPGSHSICGDTAYPGSSQPVAAKACTSFKVLGKVTTPSPSPPQPESVGTDVPLPVIGVAVLVLLAIGTGLLLRFRR